MSSVAKSETNHSLKGGFETERGLSSPRPPREGWGGLENPPSVWDHECAPTVGDGGFETERGLSSPRSDVGGQECPPSVWDGGFETERGLSSPRSDVGGQECPPTVGSPFFSSYGEIDKTTHHFPHWQQGDAWVFVTWRLADSLPKAKLDQWRVERLAWMKHHPEPWDEKTEAEYHGRFSREIDEWLDQGSGSCVLKDPANAMIVADALQHFDAVRYNMASFVVMPNHVHVLFRPLRDHGLAKIVKSWKGFTAREINKRLVKAGALWQDEYWDRLIRNERHFYRVAEYIRKNPEKAKLREGDFILWERERGLSSPLPPREGWGGLENPPSVGTEENRN